MQFLVVLGAEHNRIADHAFARQRHVPLHPPYRFSRPRLDDVLQQELAERLLQVARARHVDGKRWWLLRECDVALQDQLEARFHLYGQGMLLLLRGEQEIDGVILLSHPTLFQNVQDARDCGSCGLLLADLFMMWLSSVAPAFVTKEGEATRLPTPPTELATIADIAQIVEPLQTTPDGFAMMEAMEAVAGTDLPLPNVSDALWQQVCPIFKQVCQADLVVALTMTDSSAYQVAYALNDKHSWTRNAPELVQDFPLTTEQLQAPWPDRFVGQVLSHHQPLHLRSAHEVHQQARLFSGSGMQSLLVLPIEVKGRVLAQLVVARRQTGGYHDLLLSVACTMGTLVNGLWHTQRMEHERNVALRDVAQAWRVASTITTQALDVLANVVTEHGALLANHPQQVADMAAQVALALHLAPVEIFHIRTAALLCDIGMIGVPSSTLRSNRALTPSEQLLLHAHPQTSARLLQNFDVLKDILPIIVHHHERFDGSGYPDHLAGTAIPVGARVLAVADAFVSMQAERAYRPAFSATEALQQLREGAGHLYDAHMVRALEQVLEERS
jgi:HD-GYP domain-containing protein (c-di-GMP phosphodiesterase class II)